MTKARPSGVGFLVRGVATPCQSLALAPTLHCPGDQRDPSFVVTLAPTFVGFVDLLPIALKIALRRRAG